MPVVLIFSPIVPVVPPSEITPAKLVPPDPDPVRLTVNGLVLPLLVTRSSVSRLLELFAQLWLPFTLICAFELNVTAPAPEFNVIPLVPRAKILVPLLGVNETVPVRLKVKPRAATPRLRQAERFGGVHRGNVKDRNVTCSRRCPGSGVVALLDVDAVRVVLTGSVIASSIPVDRRRVCRIHDRHDHREEKRGCKTARAARHLSVTKTKHCGIGTWHMNGLVRGEEED